MSCGIEPRGKEKYRDRQAGPLRCIDATSDGVEAGAVGVSVGRRDPTALVVLRTACALEGADRAGEAAVARRQRARRTRVQSHVVRLLLVDSLDDIDLPAVRPAGTHHPERRPGAANAGRHVVYVDDEKPELIRGAAGQSDAWAPLGSHVAAVYHHPSIVGCALYQPILRGIVGLILDEAVSGVDGVPNREFCRKSWRPQSNLRSRRIAHR